MTAITYVATTAEGNTVIRTSATKEYAFVILAKNQISGPARANDDVEGAWGWSGDKANAEKTAQAARKAYRSVRVVPVEQKFTGKEARMIRDAVKAAPTQGSGSQYQGGSVRNGAAPMGKIETPAIAEVVTEEKEIPVTATKTAPKAKAKAAPKAAANETEKVAKAIEQVQGEAELAELVAKIRVVQAELADLLGARNAKIDELLTAGTSSGPKIAKIVGTQSAMAVYNMRKKASA